MPSLTVGEIVDFVEGTFTGDREVVVIGVRSLADADSGHLSFLSNPKYRPLLNESRAAAVLVVRDLEGESDRWIRVANPYLALAGVLKRWFAEIPLPTGISERASIASTALMGAGVRIGAFVSIGERCVLGDGVSILDGTFIGADSTIGDGTLIHPNATIYHGTTIGQRCIVHAGVVIGADGYGFATANGVHHKIPQIGIVRIGNDVEIGAGTTIDRAALGETVIGDGTKIDNLVMIAHNVKAGRHCLIVSQVGISGSTEVGDHVVFGGQSGSVGHVRIGSGMRVGARAVVTKDWDSNETISGFPARRLRDQQRSEALVRRLPEILERLERLEKRAAEPDQNEES